MNSEKRKIIQGWIEVTGAKDNKYTWKVDKQTRITINLPTKFSDLHLKSFRCKYCSGAYVSEKALKTHIADYHLHSKKVKVLQPSTSQSKDDVEKSEVGASSSSKSGKSRKRKHGKEKKSSKEKKKIFSSSESESEIAISSEESEAEDASEDELMKSKREKRGFRELTPNSDYTDEASQEHEQSPAAHYVEILSSNIDDGLSQEEMKAWLRSNLTPVGKLKDYAFKTKELRKKDVDSLIIRDFLKEWPLYFSTSGLCDFDFTLRNKQTGNLMEVWPNLTNSVVSFAGGEEALKSTLGVNVHLRLTNEQRQIASLMILPNLIRSYRKMSSEMYSCSDARDVFYRVAPHDADLASKAAAKSTKKPPEQPYVLLTGKLPSMQFESYSVVMDTHVIPCDTFLQAVDYCFKIYWIFECEYPAEAEQIWRFLGYLVYSLDEEEKRLLPSTAKLLQKLF